MAPGVGPARDALRAGRARLVVVATDGAAGQREKVEPLARHRSVPVLELAARAELGAAIGTPPITALAVTDASLAEAIRASARTDETNAGI